MSRRSRFTVEEKIRILGEFQEMGIPYSELRQKYGIDFYTICDWKRKYKIYGMNGLEHQNKNKQYSQELKMCVVQEYLSGAGSQREISRKYGLHSKKQLQDWVKKYNGHEELKSYNPGDKVMTKGRKTTLTERIEIAQYCLANNYEYQETSEKFQVSYQQVYQWVKKLEDGGMDALKDGRGRTKSEEELTEVEKLRLENKRLANRNTYLELQNEFLKKLEEIERSRF